MPKAPALLVASFLLVSAVAACSGDDSSGGGNSQTPVPPSNCPATPCKTGAMCFGPAEAACNGTWYCWSDQAWHCAPQDSGAGGGAPDTGAGDDGGAEAAADAGGG